MIASEIVKTGTDLNINTVQAALRSLIKKNYIEVAEIVYSGTVLTRSYRAVVKLSLIHISEPTRPEPISYAVFCLKKFFFNDTATTEIYTLEFVGSVRCV